MEIIRSRIIASIDGSKKVFSILDTLEKYVYLAGDKILKYHVNESV